MSKPLAPREYLENFLTRRARAKELGVALCGNRDLDDARMAHAYGAPKRSLDEILESYKAHDWKGMVEYMEANSSRER